ncbi:hypothetical protein FRC18_003806 [Serendipita sp. 400]|nr:hypothetical protein FRC18_003806 [Serendipita sp. 400]
MLLQREGGHRVPPRPLSLPWTGCFLEKEGKLQVAPFSSPPPPPYEPSTLTAPNLSSQFSPFTPTPPMLTTIPFTPSPVAPAPLHSSNTCSSILPLPPDTTTTPIVSSTKGNTSLFPGNSPTSEWSEQTQGFSLSGSSSTPLAPIDTRRINRIIVRLLIPWRQKLAHDRRRDKAIEG